jgi:hypothetical protein
MPIRVKVASTGSSTDWRSIKKLWVKHTSGWSAANALYAKVLNGWTKMWPGNAPAVDLNDPINLRLGGYNGTVASSPQLFASSDTGGTFLKLWGNDGSYTGATPITLSNRRILCADNVDGQTARFSLSGNDTIDFATTNQGTRDLAEGYFLFYQLLASNIDGELDAYSPAVKVIKRKPALVSYNAMSEGGGVLSGQSGFDPYDIIEVSAQIRYGWWIKPGGYLGGTPVLRWWRNTSNFPGGTLLKEINIETGYDYVSNSVDSNYLYNYNTSNVLTIDSLVSVGANPLQPGEYIIAQLYLENSYTAHYGSPVSYYGTTGSSPSIVSVSVLDDRGQTVVDNSLLPDQLGTAQNPSYVFSAPRIISEGYLNFYLTVADAGPSTSYRLEPRLYNLFNGEYYNFNSTGTIESGWSVDLDTPFSVSLNGTTATVRYRIFINSNRLTGTPTVSGGKARWQFEFRLSAATSSISTRKFYTGNVNLGALNVFALGNSGAAVEIAPSTVPTLNASPITGSAPLQVSFSGTATSFPSGYASYPRAYVIDFGDGSFPTTINHSTNFSNPSFSGVNHTYSNTGTYIATMHTIPQGDTTLGTRTRTITIGNFPTIPTFLSATTDRTDGVQLTFSGSNNATGYDIFWNTSQTAAPSENASPDFTGVSSPFLDTTISSAVTRWYWVRGRNSSGVSSWYPVGNGVTGTRQALANPTITSLTASAPTTSSQQFVTVTVNWQSTNQQSYFLNVFQSGVANYQDTGTTATSSSQSDSGSNFNVFSGASATISLTVYNGPNQTGGSASSTITYTPPIALSKLATPTGVNATDDRTDGVNVTWNAVSGAAYYGVWYGPLPGYDSFADFGGNRDVNLITGTSYLDTAIGSGVTRDYYVQAYRSGDPSGTKSDWGGPNSGTRAVVVANLTPPSIYFVSSGNAGGPVTVYFSGGSGPWYQIWWTTGVGGNSYDEYGSSNPITDNTGPTSAGTYFAYVRSVSQPTNVGLGPSPTISAWSAGYQFTVTSPPPPVAAPTTPTGLNVTGSGAVTWNASSGSDSYDLLIYTATNSSGSGQAGPYSANTSSTSFQLTSSQGYSSPNNWARVQVRGRNNSGQVSTYGAWFPSSTTYV